MKKQNTKSWVNVYGGAIHIAGGGILIYLLCLIIPMPPSIRYMISNSIQVILDLVCLTGLLAVNLSLHSCSRRVRLSFGFLLASILSLLVGNIVWAVLGTMSVSYPYDSVTVQWVFLLQYPLFFVGVLLLPAVHPAINQRMKTLLEGAIIIISVVLGYWNYLISPVLFNSRPMTGLTSDLFLLYIGMSTLYMAALLMFRSRQKNLIHHNARTLIILSGITSLTTDGIYSYLLLTGHVNGGTLLETGWMLGSFLMGLAAWIQFSENLTANSTDFHILSTIDSVVGKVFPYIPYVILVAGFLLLIQSHELTDTERFNDTAIGVGSIIALAILRLGIEYIDNTRLNGQLSHTLEKIKQQQQELSRTNRELEKEIAERRQAEERLAYDALHDWLTGLPNRVLFLDRLSQALDYSRRCSDIRFSVLFLDLDQFKVINDSMGHQVGDMLLTAVTRKLTKCVRISDTVARFGGDEFVFLLESANDAKSIKPVTDRILNELSSPFDLFGQNAFISASIGVVYDISGYDNAEDILRDADTAMYHAKALGKARAAFFEPSLRTKAISRLEIENDLRKALEKEQFSIHYQPIIRLDSETLVGFEALIRWRHPLRGMIPPLDFIPIAEESGLIIPIGKWVLYEACSQLKYWQGRLSNRRDLFMNVNISGRQFSKPGFVEDIQEVLAATGLHPSNLKLEITESTLIENYTMANAVFNRLAEMDIQFEIDDFGTGYSSIEYLRHFPIHTIKIDKSFIHDLTNSNRGADLIQAIIVMANNLGMETIAEGVETRDQLELLRQMRCSFGQGYYLSKPLDSEQAEAFLLSRRQIHPIANPPLQQLNGDPISS